MGEYTVPMKIPQIPRINREALLSVFAVVFLVSIFAVPYVGRGALNVPYPTGVPRCYFLEPYGGVYHLLNYPQKASYEGTVSTDALGKQGDTPPVTAFDVKWAAVKDSDTVAYKFDFLSSDDYIAVLSAPGAGSIPAIRNENTARALEALPSSTPWSLRTRAMALTDRPSQPVPRTRP